MAASKSKAEAAIPNAIMGAVDATYQYQWEPTAGLLAVGPTENVMPIQPLNLFPKSSA